MKRPSDIKMIALGLIVLYGVSFLAYLQYFRAPIIKNDTIIFLVLFGFLIIAAVAAVQLKEWGRKALLMLNVILGVYMLRPYLTLNDYMNLSYPLMCFIIYMFFNQDQIKLRFQTARVDSGPWRSVLIIDDDETLIKTARPVLISRGFSVLTAMSGEDGLTVIKSQKPDIILLDVILPGIKGRDVCKKIKENPETKDIPVVFFTAKDSADDIQAEMEVGAEDHITKPVDPKALIDTIDRILKS